MIVWLTKVAHIAGIAVWVGGLIALPFLLAERRGLEGEALERLQRLTRFLHVAVVSPAAFVAVGTGTALIFLRQTWVEWFSIKLGFVGLLVIAHILTGFGVLRTFRADVAGGGGLGAVAGLGTLAATAGILWFVLAKPEIDAGALGPGLFRPGGLGALLAPVAEPVIDAATP